MLRYALNSDTLLLLGSNRSLWRDGSNTLLIPLSSCVFGISKTLLMLRSWLSCSGFPESFWCYVLTFLQETANHRNIYYMILFWIWHVTPIVRTALAGFPQTFCSMEVRCFVTMILVITSRSRTMLFYLYIFWLKTAFAVLVQEGGRIGARLVRGKGK